jgi:hypothetical protein
MEKEKINRNDYFKMLLEHGRRDTEARYDILDLDLSKYHLRDITRKVVNNNFMEETVNRNGNYMLSGHWWTNLSYSFADKCGFDLTVVDSYSAYAFSDEQMAVFTYCEGDINFTPFTDMESYLKEKKETIDFYKGK